MKVCTKSKAAKLLKVSRATIYAMIARGELVPDELGYVDLDQLPVGKNYSKPGRKCKEKNVDRSGEEQLGGVRTESNDPTRYVSILEQGYKQLEEDYQNIKSILDEMKDFIKKYNSAQTKQKENLDMTRSILTQVAEGLIVLESQPDSTLREYSKQVSRVIIGGIEKIQKKEQELFATGFPVTTTS